MANWSNPTLTSLYTDFVTEVKNRDVDLALGLDPATTSPTNVPANAIRWNSASFKYQKWDGSTWNDLSTKYIFTAVEVSGATVPVNGMYLSTTNTLNFSTASTASRLTIDGSGNVNIGSGTFYVDAVGNRTGVNNTSPGSYNAAADDLVVGLTGDTGVTIASTNQGSIFFADGTTGGAQQAAGYLYYLHSSDSMGFGTANTLRMTLDASGNFGLGVTPSAWNSAIKAIQLGAAGAITGQTGNPELVTISANKYVDAGGTNRYINTANATEYYQYAGAHYWLSAGSGTAGNAITFTQVMTLDASGNLGVGPGATSPSSRFHCVGSKDATNFTIGAPLSTVGGAAFVNYSQVTFENTSGSNSNAAIRAYGNVWNTAGSELGFLTSNNSAPVERCRINNLGYMQGTVNGLGAGRIPAKQYYRLDSAFTGTNGTAAQPIYGVGVTLIGSTVYEFEAIYAFSRSAGSTSHTMSFLFGGTATINNIFYTGVGPGDGVLPPLSTYDGAPASFVATSAGASVATAAMTIGTGIFYIVKGTVSINAGGTFIPQYQLSAAPGGAYSTYAGAYFSIWPLAASGAAVNIGSWA